MQLQEQQQNQWKQRRKYPDQHTELRHLGVLTTAKSTFVPCNFPLTRVFNPPILHPATHGFPPYSEKKWGLTSATSLGPNLSPLAIAESPWFQVDCCFLVFIPSSCLDSILSITCMALPAPFPHLPPFFFFFYWVVWVPNRQCSDVLKGLKTEKIRGLKIIY